MTIDISKELKRLAKIKEREQNLDNPKRKTTGIRTIMTEAQRLKKREAKAREDFVKDVMSQKNEVLKEEVEDFGRIMELVPISEKGIEEAQEVISTYDIEMAKLQAQMYLLEQKKKAAENDIDLLTDALAALAEFNEAVKAYALSCIENTEEFDPDEIIDLWENMMPQNYVDALNRGTTAFSSLDYLFGTTIGEFKNDPALAMKSLSMKVEKLFDRYNIGEPEAPDMEAI